MDTLAKTIRRLSEEDYQDLLKDVSTDRYSKPYMVLETVRTKNVTDTQMIELLQVNPSTYYTLKSRLNTKVAAALAKKVDNPISKLMDEVARVPASLYGTNREVAIRSLKELEKHLLEYDMSNELIIVYKTLAQLNLFQDEYDHYYKLYTKYQAFSLAGMKAENMYYEFLVKAGLYDITRDESTKEDLQRILREMSNISELYESHRLFVFFQVARMYYFLLTSMEPGQLQAKEMEIDQTLQEVRKNFEKYPLDTLYNNLKFLPDLLYFIYYTRAGNMVRARYHYQALTNYIHQFTRHNILNFHTIQYLKAKSLFLIAGNEESGICSDIQILEENMDLDKQEHYHYIYYHYFKALCHYYQKEYGAAAKAVHNIRNDLGIKQYIFTDIELKLFQALQYALLREENLFQQIAGSITRSLDNDTQEEDNVRVFLKICKTSFKSTDSKKRFSRIKKLIGDFTELNKGENSVLLYVKLDEKLMDRLSK